MNARIWKIVVGGSIAGMALLAMPVAAHAAVAPDWGQIPGPAGATCDSYWVDPPVAAHVTSDPTTVDGANPSSPTVDYDGNVTHRANFVWTGAQSAALHVPGPHTVAMAFSWDLTSSETPPLLFSTTLTCVELPPPTTTVPETTTTTVPPVVPPVSAVPPTAAPPAGAGGTLPHTGPSDVGLLTFLGAGLSSAGVVAARLRRKVGR